MVATMKTLTPAEWEKIEREEHNRINQGSTPFFSKDDRIDVKAVLSWEDYCYKPNSYKPDAESPGGHAATLAQIPKSLHGHRTKRLFELMDINHLRGKKVLDVGCGDGSYPVLYSLLGAEVWAFDLSPVAVEIGKRSAEANGVSDRCKFSIQNASSMSYGDAVFDIIVFQRSLHHVIKYPRVHEETLRVLKPGGMVVIAESLRGNVFLEFARKITMKGEEAKGDVVLDLDDIKEFARGFSFWEIELMSLLFMFKRVVKNHTGNGAIRGLLYALKNVDDFLFHFFPVLKKYSGECVVRLIK
jgi:ubiquinone/menaquinone biosynthesis C-methylase UbiE